jgi:hypothetical protein
VRRRLALLLSALVLLPGLPGAHAATPTAGQSTYVPVDPVRILDTRDAGRTQVPAGGTIDLLVVGVNGVPLDATAVVLNVTATGSPGATDIRVYPTPADAGYPDVSNLNVAPRATIANLVTSKVGQNGMVRLRSSGSAVHLIADLSGYYVENGAGASYTGLTPRRLLDTRETRNPLQAGVPQPLAVRGGSTGVPDAATAVALNVTATEGTSGTDIRVYPTRAGQGPPTVSNLNPPARATVAAAAIVAIGDDGTVSLRSSAGTVHAIVDLAGYFLPGADAGVFHPLPPVRLLDTRVTGPAVGPAGTRDVVVAGAGTVPFPAKVVVLNVTAVGASRATDVRVYPTPGDNSVPLASNLNVAGAQAVPNTVIATVGRDGSVRLRNAAGTVHLIVDLAGWYGPAGDGWDISWPQCSAAGSPDPKPLPAEGAFAIVGLTRSIPFTSNECFAKEWEWASARPGEPAVYLNVNAPGSRATPDGQVWTEVCGTGTPTSTCGTQYGVRLAQYALERLPTAPGGGKPMVWMDVEGPYANGPYWQTGYAGAVAVNRAVLNGAVDTLRTAGYRVGIYSDRGTSSANDWKQIMGEYRLLQTQNWVFTAPTADAHALCTPDNSFSGGPVVLVQVQPAQSGQAFDVDHAC